MVPAYAKGTGIKKENRKVARKRMKIHVRFSSVQRSPWLRCGLGEAVLSTLTASRKETMIHRWHTKKNKDHYIAPAWDIWDPLETVAIWGSWAPWLEGGGPDRGQGRQCRGSGHTLSHPM